MRAYRKGGAASTALLVLFLFMLIILICGGYMVIRDARDEIDDSSSSANQNNNGSSSSSSSSGTSEPPKEEPVTVTVDPMKAFVPVSKGSMVDNVRVSSVVFRVDKRVVSAFSNLTYSVLVSDMNAGELYDGQPYVSKVVLFDGGEAVFSASSWITLVNETDEYYELSITDTVIGFLGVTGMVSQGETAIYTDLLLEYYTAEEAAKALFVESTIGLYPETGKLHPYSKINMTAWYYLTNVFTEYNVTIGGYSGRSTFTSEQLKADLWDDRKIDDFTCFFSTVYNDFRVNIPYWEDGNKFSVYFTTDILGVGRSKFFTGDRLNFQGEDRDQYVCDSVPGFEAGYSDRLFWARNFVMLTDKNGKSTVYYGPNASVVPSEVEAWQEFLP